MNLTINFILLFLIIIFPGIVFRRFYFYGDFSKQFKIKEPLNNLFIANIIPGVILLVSSLLVISLFEKESTQFSDLLANIFLLDKDNNKIDDKFFNDFLFVVGATLSMAIVSGYLAARIIRLFKRDIRFKLLQYKNVC